MAIICPGTGIGVLALQWKEEWPEATLYGCPGLKAKDSAYDEEVGDDAPAGWLGEIEAAHAKYEAVPIFNRPFFSEVCDGGQASVDDSTVPHGLRPCRASW